MRQGAIEGLQRQRTELPAPDQGAGGAQPGSVQPQGGSQTTDGTAVSGGSLQTNAPQGVQPSGAVTVLPPVSGTLVETSDRSRAFTYLPSRYERSHRFSVSQVAGADAIVCMLRDGTPLNIDGPKGQVFRPPPIVGEYSSSFSGQPIGCTRASSTLFDPTGRNGEVVTILILTPVVGQGIVAGLVVAPVWQVAYQYQCKYGSDQIIHAITRGETWDLRRSL